MSDILAAFDKADAATPSGAASGGVLSAFDAAAQAASPAPPSPAAPTYKQAGRWSRDVDSQAALGGMVVHGITGLGATILGGYHALGKLATGGSLDDAVAALRDDQQRLTYTTDDQTSPEAQGIRAMDSQSLANPLSWPAKAGGLAGSGVSAIIPNQIGGTDLIPLKAALSAGADAGVQVFGPIKAPAIIRGATGAMRSLSDLGRISPQEAAYNAAAIKARAVAAVAPPEPPQPLTRPQESQQSQSTAPQSAQSQPTPQPQAQPQAAPAPVTSSAPAPATAAPTIADASPELQQAVVKQAETLGPGEKLDPTIVQRHVEADTLPVPVRLTAGQAAMDPAMISNEMNSRGKAAPPVPPEFYNAQGKALASNLDAIRERVGPDVVAENPTEHGQVLVDEYKAMDAPVVADISAKYKALEDANGGNFPIDGQAFAANTQAALDKALKSGSVPSDLQANLDKFANGRQMTFQDFETMRSDAADAQRTAADGRQRAAAGIVRQQLENMPLTPEAAALKPLADEARAAAKARFDTLDADPAYKAAVSDGIPHGEPSPLADSFVQKYVIGAPRANVANMRANLANSPIAQQTIPAATVDYLRGKAKADTETGGFNQAGYNRAAEILSPKFDQLLDPQTAQQVSQVGRVAKYTQVQPKGSYVNNSNTLVGAASQVGMDIVKNALAIKTLGASKVAGNLIQGAKSGAASKAAIAPGAGITKMSDLLPPKQD